MFSPLKEQGSFNKKNLLSRKQINKKLRYLFAMAQVMECKYFRLKFRQEMGYFCT